MAGCGGDGGQQRAQLEQLEQQNVSMQPMLNDSLAEALVSYFDRHGDANERMRAKYILGRTYYCLGELPRALEIYNEAADCADTTSANCDFAKLSRIYAQKAEVFHDQVQPRSELKELGMAEYYAKKGNDSLMAIECYALQADAFDYLHQTDSVISIKNKAARLFNIINRKDRAYQTLSTIITALINKNEIDKAEEILYNYEMFSGFFDNNGNIIRGREVYYYIKGKFYLAVNEIDSAEYMFRKELRDGKDLNNQIAGCKGLQEVYEHRRIPDSIAKYATLSYELNDSAYSLSEMQNIQKLQASYNYNHQKYLAEKKNLEATVAWLLSGLILIVVLLGGAYFGMKYRQMHKVALDYRLRKAGITHHLKKLANANPPQYPTNADWDQLRMLVEREIPSFRKTLKVDELSLTEMDYDVCLMVRVHLLPIEMSKLKQCTPSHISNIRKRLLLRIFGIEGGSDDFDDEIGKIGS